MRLFAPVLAITLLALPANAAPSAPASASARPEAASEAADDEYHPPAPFNFIDTNKFMSEKVEAAKGGEPPTTPYIYLLLNFIALMSIYYFAFGKTFAGMLKARKEAFEKQVADAHRVYDEAAERLKQYESKLAASDTELSMIRAELLAQGEAERDRIVKDAERNVESIRHDAMRMVEQEIKQLREDLLRETVNVAATSARQALTSKLTPADQDRFATAFIDDVARADSKVLS